MSGNIIIEL